MANDVSEGVTKMGYDFKHQNLTAQQQELLRQEKRAEKKRFEEEKDRLELVGLKIIEHLKTQKEPVTRNEIFSGIGLNSLDISKALRLLKNKKIIDSVPKHDKISGLDSPHFFIRKSE